MEGIDDGWLEAILKKSEAERSVVRVCRSEHQAATGKGDSYASDMFRIKMDVVLGSGKKAKRSVIYKTMPSSETRAADLKKNGMFEREIKVYKDVLPLMEDLMEEFGDRTEPMWGRCFHYHPYDSLTLEDLKERGYSMGERRKGLDLAHCTLAIKSLARFHALSVILKERGLINEHEFYHSISNAEPELLQYFHNKAFTALSNVIDNTWGPEWGDCSERLKKLVNNHTAERVLNIVLEKDGPPPFKVFCHGDPWVTNMMFNYLPDSDTPIHVKFIDFQLSHLNSYGYDLQYFLTISPNIDVRRDNIEELLVAYETTLRSVLIKYGYTKGDSPTLEDIKKELHRFDFFSFLLICGGLSYMMSEPENVPDIEELIKEYYEKKEPATDERTYLNPLYTQYAQLSFKSFIKNGTI